MKVEALKADLEVKSKAATAGWDAAANAKSEAEAAEARGLQAGIKRGQSEAERKVGNKSNRASNQSIIFQASPNRRRSYTSLGNVLGSGHQTRACTGA